MTSRERTLATFAFSSRDYVPLYDQYWGDFVNAWRSVHDLPTLEGIPMDDVTSNCAELLVHYHVDLQKVGPVEAPWPSKAELLSSDGRYIVQRDDWGRMVRRTAASPYGEPLEVPLSEKRLLDTFEFESPRLDSRYTAMLNGIAWARSVLPDPYVFIKIGGPYLRSSFLRGEVQWYLDIMEDPAFASALIERVASHLIEVGSEAIRRSGIEQPSIWIFDDVASNAGPLISPDAYEQLILPAIRRMAAAFKEAGAPFVGLHSDGDIRLLLDGLVDAGIGAINPVEPRANMDVVELRNRYGKRLALFGGMCNSHILPFGTEREVEEHITRLMDVAQEGGVIVASHSVSGDISVERYEYVMRLLHAFGRPMPGDSSI